MSVAQTQSTMITNGIRTVVNTSSTGYTDPSPGPLNISSTLTLLGISIGRFVANNNNVNITQKLQLSNDNGSTWVDVYAVIDGYGQAGSSMDVTFIASPGLYRVTSQSKGWGSNYTTNTVSFTTTI